MIGYDDVSGTGRVERGRGVPGVGIDDGRDEAVAGIIMIPRDVSIGISSSGDVAIEVVLMTGGGFFRAATGGNDLGDAVGLVIKSLAHDAFRIGDGEDISDAIVGGANGGLDFLSREDGSVFYLGLLDHDGTIPLIIDGLGGMPQRVGDRSDISILIIRGKDDW